MILMQVLAMMRKDHVWIEFGLDLLEIVLDLGAHIGEIAVTKRLNDNPPALSRAQEHLGAGLRFSRPLAASAKHDPQEVQVGIVCSDLENGAAATNLDVIAVGPQTQDAPCRPCGQLSCNFNIA